jgi:hypothetical protein
MIVHRQDRLDVSKMANSRITNYCISLFTALWTYGEGLIRNLHVVLLPTN